jgi:hypothetical protein
MNELVKFRLSESDKDGDFVVVEVEAQEAGIARAARPGEIAAEAAQSLEAALEAVRPTADLLLAKLTSLLQRPQEVVIEFGLRLTVKTGVVIASGEGEGHFQVTLTWKPS